MADSTARRRPTRAAARVAAATIAMLAVLVGIGAPAPTSAHTPHDAVTQVALSPSFDTDGIGFVVSEGRLFRSDDAMETLRHRSLGLGTARVLQVAVAPSDPSVVYVGSNDGRVFVSDDGGNSFVRSAIVIDGSPIVRIAVSPTDPRQLVVAGFLTTLARSIDGGTTWFSVSGLGIPTALTATSTLSSRFVTSSAGGGVFVSDDSGASWLRSSGVIGSDVSAVAVSPSNDALVVTGDQDGAIHVSINGAVSFARVAADGLPAAGVQSLTVSTGSAGELLIWATLPDGLYLSDDAGVTFTRFSNGIDVDPDSPRLGLPGYGNVAASSDGSSTFAAAHDGLFRLGDEGWEHVEIRADAIVGLAVSPNFADDSTLVVTTYVKGAFISTDGGVSLEAINGGLDREVGRSNTALPVDRLQQFTFSPDFADDQLLLGSTENEVLRSADGGQRWQSFEVGTREPGEPTPHHAFGVAPNGTTPTFVMGTRTGEVFRSDRLGAPRSWRVQSNLESPIRSIVLNADFARRPDVFVGTALGVFRSIDGARSFERVNPQVRDALFAISPDYTSDGTVFAGSRNGLQVSRDFGTTWTPINLLFDPVAPVDAVAVSPTFAEDGVVLANMTGIGLVRSVDRGLSFAPVGTDLAADHLVIGTQAPTPRSTPIVFANDGTVFAHTDATLLRSDDLGSSWQVLDVPRASEFDAASTALGPLDETSQTGEAGDTDESDVAVGDEAPVDATSAQPGASTSLAVESTDESDRRIWLLTASICAVALGFLLVTARRRR